MGSSFCGVVNLKFSLVYSGDVRVLILVFWFGLIVYQSQNSKSVSGLVIFVAFATLCLHRLDFLINISGVCTCARAIQYYFGFRTDPGIFFMWKMLYTEEYTGDLRGVGPLDCFLYFGGKPRRK